MPHPGVEIRLVRARNRGSPGCGAIPSNPFLLLRL
jgi:hypothetical protein